MTRPDSMLLVERQVLCTVMFSPSLLADVPLQPHHFAHEHHGALWELILALQIDGKPIDHVAVSELAERQGSRALASLAQDVGTSSLALSSRPTYLADLIRGAWRGREAHRIAVELADAAGRREDGAIDTAIAGLMALHAEDADCEHTAKTALKAAWEEVQLAHEHGGALIGVPTGLYDLDDTLGGLHDSDLIVIGARPAMGKTGLLLGMVLAGSEKGPVGLISAEQPASQVGLRWMAAGSQVGVGKLRAAKIQDEQWPRISRACTDLGPRPIRIFDRSSPDIAEVIRVARRWKQQHGIKALYVDYLQKLEIAAQAQAPKHERVGAIARALKNLARDLNIPVIALAQVARKVEERQNQRPGMADLADSSEIEKEADQIMTLWRDQSNPQAETAPAEINVVKNRHGNIGTIHCLWRGAQTAFVNLHHQPDERAA
jgi:replicative DNA helicase